MNPVVASNVTQLFRNSRSMQPLRRISSVGIYDNWGGSIRDIALSLADAIALIDPPCLSCLPTEEMRRSGCIERLFRNNSVTFDTATGSIKVKQ